MREAVERKNNLIEGEWYDTYRMGMLEEEWKERKNKGEGLVLLPRVDPDNL